MKLRAFTLGEPFDVAQGKLPVVRKRKRCAFTLIELLVVIAVLSILIAMLTPTLRVARDLAGTETCKSNLKTHSVAVAQFTADYMGYLPANSSSRPRHNQNVSPQWYPDGAFWEFSGAGSGSDVINGESWCEKHEYLDGVFVPSFWPYYEEISKGNGWICPTHPRAGETKAFDSMTNWERGTHPFYGWSGSNRTFYLMNAEASSRWKPVEPYMTRRKRRIQAILRPGELMMFTDRRDYLDDDDQDFTTTSFYRWTATIAAPGQSVGSSMDDIGLHHQKGFNASFVDGHVKRIKVGLPMDQYLDSHTEGDLRWENFVNDP